MAISHIQPFLLLLVVSPFFLVCAAVEFKNCFGDERYAVKVNDVVIYADSYALVNRNGTFLLLADSLVPIKPEEAIIIHMFQKLNSVSYIKTYTLCDITPCPVVPGPVNFTFTDTFSAGPKKFPVTEDFQIVIEKFADRYLTTLMCVEFRLWPNDHDYVTSA